MITVLSDHDIEGKVFLLWGAVTAVEALERTLLIDGWEPLSRGGHWYSRKYRRRIQT